MTLHLLDARISEAIVGLTRNLLRIDRRVRKLTAMELGFTRHNTSNQNTSDRLGPNQGTCTRMGYSSATLISLFFIFMSGCADNQPPVTIESLRSSEDPDQESWNVDLTITENGYLRLHLTAGHVLKYERPDSIFMLLQSADGDSVRVKVDIFDVAGDSSAVVFADRIYYYERENRFVAHGDVVATSISGTVIESEHLTWTEEDRKLRTPGFATITESGRRTSGYRLVANEDLSEAILENFTGTTFSTDADPTESSRNRNNR
ncbi:MAG: LPS export ABC transporter periplasmic protein LptC [Bacteroidetes bacterium]|nr:MAG: LPS export ABC transporter periplasmic protein LptC [Bacteroidota bacterium]